MSNDLLDDPMDTGAPAGALPAAPPMEQAGEEPQPQPPRIEEDREADAGKQRVPIDMNTLAADLIAGQTASNIRMEEKRDREAFDEAYDLNVSEPAVDLEALACFYEGDAFFLRCRFVAKHCTALRADAYISLINYLKEETKDIGHYIAFFNELDTELGRERTYVSLSAPLKDHKWVEETGIGWQTRLDALQLEYKRHKDEGVKESTRRAMEDLFQHYLIAGRVEEAIRLYSRGIRDYCTQLKHSINMWLNWIEVSIMANDWNRLESITNTAHRSLKDADDAEKASHTQQQQRGENATYMLEPPAQGAPSMTNRQLIETALAKVLTAQVLLKLRNGRYAQVATDVLLIKTEHLQAKWFVTASDLGIYAMLCAMATMERAKLRAAVSGNGAFRRLLESEPHFIELLNSYTSSRFGRCFEIMYAVKNRLLLDPFMSRNVDTLFTMIRRKCVVQYLQPYSSVKLETMCAALGTTVQELQLSLLDLCESKSISLRIDQSVGVIRMIDETDEATTLRRVNETCDRAILRARSLLWKTTLASANIHSIVDKETRQKRKQHGRDRMGLDEDELIAVNEMRRGAHQRIEGSSSTTSTAAPISDDFAVFESVEQVPFDEDLGDI
ncbi:unnamed protein product [Caenorhabditis sp. 36 PRJEB53466]|nr:unnamed protein product [Caenorhabditis sp. 36 PRJEB53466]